MTSSPTESGALFRLLRKLQPILGKVQPSVPIHRARGLLRQLMALQLARNSLAPAGVKVTKVPNSCILSQPRSIESLRPAAVLGWPAAVTEMKRLADFRDVYAALDQLDRIWRFPRIRRCCHDDAPYLSGRERNWRSHHRCLPGDRSASRPKVEVMSGPEAPTAHLLSFQISVPSFQSFPTFSQTTTYFADVFCGVEPSVFRL